MALSGKIDHPGFEQIILPYCGQQRPEVKSGPAFGVDVSLIELPGKLGLALTSDPLSLIPSLGLQESAWLSVHLMANDMATTGFAPQYAQMVLNLPPTLTEADFKNYWEFVHQYCKAIGVAITGGHTGSIEGQNSTIAGGGTMVLTAPFDEILLSRYARSGDAIIVTKQCAMSSAAILAMSFPETVKNKLGTEVYNDCCALFYQTSSLPDALAAKAINKLGLTAMHDVTEGGVLGAIFEMAVASGNGVLVNNNKLPIGQPQRVICSLFDLDARFCIGAGAMVMAADPAYAPAIVQQLQAQGISATIVGELKEQAHRCLLVEEGVTAPMPYFSKDPYWAAFYNAYKNGWK
ncbi:AIR synthase family protein [Mucilaginibacter sp.]|uniref:AIR synthase family protein n=1 Tax=Mucilaginibacter sp. TaxID=1882438 RepID=UPI00326784AB